MKTILLICTLVLFGLACVKARSDNQNSNLSTPLVGTNSPSVAATPTPNPNFSKEMSTKFDNRTATKIDFGKMVKINLGSQPQTVIKMFAFWEYNSNLPKDFMTYAKRTEVYIAERDLNHDGAAEKIIFDPLTNSKDRQSPPIAIFKLEGKKWKVLFGQSADISADENSMKKNSATIEFLSSESADDFDIIKVTEKTLTNEPRQIRKTITYFQWKKNGFGGDGEIDPNMEEVYSKDSYEQVSFESYICQTAEDGKIDKAIPCVDSSK